MAKFPGLFACAIALIVIISSVPAIPGESGIGPSAPGINGDDDTAPDNLVEGEDLPGADVSGIQGPSWDGPFESPLGMQWREPFKPGSPLIERPLIGAVLRAPGPDVWPMLINFVGPEPAIGTFGAAAVGLPTQFNVTVTNSGDAVASSVSVNIRLTDYFRNVMGEVQRTIASLDPGANDTVYWSGYVPAYSTTFTINATATVAGDTNTSNDTLLYSGLSACKWIDLCDGVGAWSGDLTPGKWHVTSTIYTDPNTAFHSAPTAWYCGLENGSGAHYENGMDASLISPSLDLTMMNPNYYILLNFNYYGRSVQNSDRLEVYITDDGGASWQTLFATLSGGSSAGGWFSWVSHWSDYDGDGIVDPGEPHQAGIDLQKYAGKIVKLKLQFISDEVSNDIGFYVDDFNLRGTENLNNVALLRISAPDVDILDTEQTFTTTIKNLGQSVQSSFQVFFNVSDGTVLLTSVSPLQSGQATEVYWKWTPRAPGNYTIRCTMFPSPDEVISDNLLWRPAHVAADSTQILIVDDDSGPGNNGALRTYSAGDVEWGVRNALTMADYDVYLVANDETGPAYETLKKYGLVIWVTGYDDSFVSRTGTLSPADIFNLSRYLDGGGRLWMSSFEVMWDTWGVQKNASFARNYLHVGSFDPDMDDDAGMPNPLDGVPEDPIADGMHLNVSSPPSGLYDKSDRIGNDSSSQGIFFQYQLNKDRLSGPFNALRFSGGYKLVFLAFEFTFITNAPDRAYVANKIMEWLWKGVSLTSGTEGAQRSIRPGETAIFNLSLVNSEPRTWMVDELAAVAPSGGWTAEVTPSVVNGTPGTAVLAHSVLNFTLFLTAPLAELAGKVMIISVRARLSGSPYYLSLSTATTVLAQGGVEISCPAMVKPVSCGDEAQFTVAVHNTGNFGNQVNLSVAGEAAPWAALGRDYVFLSAGGTAYVLVTAVVPRDALAGPHNLTVRGEQRSVDAINADSVQLTIEVNATHQLKLEKVKEITSINMAQTLKATITADIGNYGNVPETVTVTVRASFPNWQYWKLPTLTRVLQPLEKGRQFDLDIEVWSQSPADNSYNLTVRVSYGSGDIAEEKSTVIRLLRPDLSIASEDLKVAPRLPGVRDNIELSATVHNVGGVSVRMVNVTFYINNVSVGSIVISEAIQPGFTATATVFGKGLRYGQNTMQVKLDPEDNIIESSEDNNAASIPVFGYQPDLWAGAITFTKAGKPPVGANGTMGDGMTEISVIVHNDGGFCTDAENVEVDFSVDGKSIETRIVTVRAGASAEAMTVWFAKKGTHSVRISIDPLKRIDEASESNNEGAALVRIAGTQVPTVENGSWVLLAAGIIALAFVAGALIYQSASQKDAGEQETRPRLLRARLGTTRKCSSCGKPIPEGGLYFRCGCGALYHKRCSPEGKCLKCSSEEE